MPLTVAAVMAVVGGAGCLVTRAIYFRTEHSSRAVRGAAIGGLLLGLAVITVVVGAQSEAAVFGFCVGGISTSLLAESRRRTLARH